LCSSDGGFPLPSALTAGSTMPTAQTANRMPDGLDRMIADAAIRARAGKAHGENS